MKFMGYRRNDGKVGIRNHVLVLATVGCSGEVARKIADSVEGAVSFVNQSGCGESNKNLENTIAILVGYAANPNVHSVLAVGLGCEANGMDSFIEKVKSRCDKPIEGIIIQDEGGTTNAIAKGIKIAQRMVIEASKCQRTECDISEFMLGIKCGGSDATSGLVSNPVMGLVSDRLVAENSTSMFTETIEMIGTEHILAARAATPELGERIKALIKKREDDQLAAGADFRTGQPSPGNKAGGITTIEEKSLGCIHKGGHTTIQEMVDYATPPTKKGLVLMDSPCYDMLAVTAMFAAGCQAVVFTTGRGNGVGNPVGPVIKVTANRETFIKQEDNHDIDMSAVIEEGMSLQEMADITYDEMISIMNGQLTKAEVLKLGYTEVVISRACDYI